MPIYSNTNIERIIAKIDNDFAIDNTDYIPRVVTWTIEALSILKCTPTEIKRFNVEVNERIANLPCSISGHIKVYDKNGCEIKELKKGNGCNCNDSFTGNLIQSNAISNTIQQTLNTNANEGISVTTNVAMDDETHSLIHITEEITKEKLLNRGYVILDAKRLELNFDTDYINVDIEKVKTVFSTVFNCELPVVPNNGILIEAIVYYCMYKILCRGVKHPVFNLSASQYGTNPYFMWTTLQQKAKRSVMFDKQGNILEEDGDLWDNSLAFFSFD